MPQQSLIFRRLVVGLQPTAAGAGLRFAAELAEMLQIELLGLFLDDSSLRDLARIPYAREFRGLSAGWQPMDLEQVSRDLARAAASLKLVFEQATRELATAVRFEVAHGSLAESVAAVSRAGDIFVVVEPHNPATRTTSQFAWLSEAAFRSRAAVLLVPARIRRSTGPIVAIAATWEDPSIRAAAALASAAKEDLVIIHADHSAKFDDDRQKLAAESGLKPEQVAATRAAFIDPAACAHAFGQLQERLVVMSRSAFGPAVASTITAARRVPVLVIGPADSTDNTPAESTGTG